MKKRRFRTIGGPPPPPEKPPRPESDYEIARKLGEIRRRHTDEWDNWLSPRHTIDGKQEMVVVLSLYNEVADRWEKWLRDTGTGEADAETDDEA